MEEASQVHTTAGKSLVRIDGEQQVEGTPTTRGRQL